MKTNAFYQLAYLHGYTCHESKMIETGEKIYEEIKSFFMPEMTAQDIFSYLNHHLNPTEQLTLNLF